MKIYNFGVIKKVANCKDVFRNILNAKELTAGRFTAPWRVDSDSGSVAVNDDGFYDHVLGVSGSSLDAVARTKVVSLTKAAEILGDHYHLKPVHIQAKKPVKITSKIVTHYNYTDPDGNIAYQSIRYDPKTFKQRKHLGKDVFSWGMKDVTYYPYLIHHWKQKRNVIVVEGEKDADNLHNLGFPATTFISGNWKDEYAPYFKGKNVVIMQDNDKPGIAQGEMVANKLCDICPKIKLLCPSHDEKGDISDLIAVLNSPVKEIKQLIADRPIYVKPPPLSEIHDLVLRAKAANKTPFSNHKIDFQKADNGKEKKTTTPTIMNELIENINHRFLNFPRRQGSSLFDHDRKTNKIRFINDLHALFAWISEKSNQPVMWNAIPGTVNKNEMYNSVYANSVMYNAISHIPSFPMRDDVYYTFDKLPEPCPNQSRLNKFCSFFAPFEEIDNYLIKVFIASVIYYRNMAKRPLWIIDSVDGKGVGKTTLIEMIYRLLEMGDDKSPITSSMSAINDENQYARLEKEILSMSGRRKRILLIDNEDGTVKSSRLCSMVTCEFFSGMSPYAKECESRPNDLTYVITSNNAIMSDDISKRSIIIQLKAPKKYANWSQKVIEYIEANRFNIFADILSLLKNPIHVDVQTTRFEMWDTDIFIPMIRDIDVINEIWKKLAGRTRSSNIDSSEAEIISSYFEESIRNELHLDPRTNCIFIHSALSIHWYRKAIETRLNDTSIIRKLRTMIREKHLLNLSEKLTSYPSNTKTSRRGLTWNIDCKPDGVFIAALEQGKSCVRINDDLL